MEKNGKKNGFFSKLIIIFVILIGVVIFIASHNINNNMSDKGNTIENDVTQNNDMVVNENIDANSEKNNIDESTEEITTDKIREDYEDTESIEHHISTFNPEDVIYNGKNINTGVIESIYFGGADSIYLDYSFNVSLELSGKVKITATDENGNSTTEYLSNLNNVIDIIKFSVPASSDEQIIYLLLESGDVYYYKIGDSIYKKYEAKKIADISKVVKLFEFGYGKSNAGGNWSIIALTEDNKYIILNKGAV